MSESRLQNSCVLYMCRSFRFITSCSGKPGLEQKIEFDNSNTVVLLSICTGMSYEVQSEVAPF